MTDRNANRLGYKKTTVGWIPEEWGVAHLGDLAVVKQGYTFRPSYQGIATGRWLYAKVSDMELPGNETRIGRAANYVSDDTLSAMGAVPFRAGSTVFPRVGAALRTNKKRLLSSDSLVDDNVLVATVNAVRLCDDHYLYWWFCSVPLDRFASNGFPPSIRGANVLSAKLALPSLTEQKCIAEILSTWDEAVGLTRALTAAAKRRKKALMQQLLTGKKRLPGFSRDHRLEKHRFFSIPTDWQYSKLMDIAAECSERNASRSQITVLSCSKHHGFIESAEYFGKQVFSEDTSNYKVIRRGWFGFPSNHVEEGSIGLLSTHDVGIVSPIYTVFKTTDAVLPEFLFAVFKTATYRHIFQISTSSSVDRRGSLRWDEFARIHVPLPSLPEQRAIAAVLAAADEEIKSLEAKCEVLERQKKGLMQKLLTGEVRVTP